MNYKEEYLRWCTSADDELKEILSSYDEAQIEDAFYRNLAFGTGGLRGVIGAGTNRMNVHTVAKATQGLAQYLIDKYGENASVCIGYDSRIKSDVFAKTAAKVFAANGVKVFMWNRLLPVPTVSYAVRSLKTSAGVMITASHNPAKYNGYKVFGEDGCQITTLAAKEILECIESVDVFEGVKGLHNSDESLINNIPEEVFDNFIKEIKNQSVLFGDEVDRNVAIVYSPLNGTGLEPITRILKEEGYSNVTIVKEQENPDGNFPTCPYPNPEIRQALELGLEYCEKTGADLMLATDPDCDRVGIAVKNDLGNYELLTGNEVGMLLLDYICMQRKKHNKMPHRPLLVKTIVTIDMAERIAKDYGLDTVNVLTGFKYIGEQIGLLEQNNEADSFVLGFEESYGYLTGGYVRDKDAVDGAYMICEMFCYYKSRSISLFDKLGELYERYGYCLNTLHSFEFEGSKGMKQMEALMKSFREYTAGCDFAGRKILKVEDYSAGIKNLPKSDVLKFYMESDCSMVVRPSGTEPKLKLYLSITSKDRKSAEEIENSIVTELTQKYFA